MAARLRAKHQDDIREKIRAALLVTRLEKHVFSDKDLLTTSQVSAAIALLKKCVPDLAQVEHSGEINLIEQLSDSELDAKLAAFDLIARAKARADSPA